MFSPKVDIDDSGLIAPAAQTILFGQPLVINANLRAGYVALGIAYGEWLRNVDVTLLTSDPIERQKPIDNIAGSMHIYAKGLGDLPVNDIP